MVRTVKARLTIWRCQLCSGGSMKIIIGIRGISALSSSMVVPLAEL
jgi:hypothetical protein